jgi:uncharacterized RDD family membrane protein YckC
MSDHTNPTGLAAAQRGNVPRGARGFQGDQAGIVTRVLAGVVDALVVGGLLLAFWIGVGALLFIAHPIKFSFPSPTYGQALAVGMVIAVGYLVVAWTAAGRTYGDQLLGLRVLDHDGGTVNWPIAVVRALLYLVFPLGVAWILVDPRNRSLQDILLRTRVIYDWRQSLPERSH